MIETFRGVVFPWLTDQMGHLTTSKYAEMFDVATYHLLDALGDSAGAGETGWADVRQVFEYKAEVRCGALVLIRSAPIAMGRRSFTALHTMTNPSGEIVHATMEAVTVRFDLVARKAIALSEAFVTAAGRVIEIVR